LLNRIDDGIGLWDGHDLERLTMIRFMGATKRRTNSLGVGGNPP
jgi:hypothetical protein